MSSRTDAPRRCALAGAVGLSLALSGCGADLYLDRRNTIAVPAGDAVATNIAIHTIDPWPAVAANRTIEHNGQVMQSAHERYRTGKVTPPSGIQTSSVKYQPSAGPAAPAATPAASQ